MIIQEVYPKQKSPITPQQKLEVEEKIKKLRKEGEKMVKGMFEFLDAQGGWLSFSYLFFPGDPIRTVRITHGEIIDVPMILAKHLNNVYKKVRIPSPERDENGSPLKPGSMTKISRTRFTPVDMM